MYKKMMSMLGLWAMMSVGCGEATEQEAQPSTGGDLCAQSAAHVSSCLGQQIAADPSCNAQDAQALLDQSCDDLSRQTSGGKGDLMCNPLFFWTDCNRGIKINATICQEDKWCDWSDGVHVEDGCFSFQIKDSQGNIVVEETTAGPDHLMTEDLDDGVYTIEVLNHDGSSVELLDSPGTLTGFDYSNDMDNTFIVEGGRSDSHTLYVPIHKDNANNMHQCGRLSSQVQLFCDGEVYRDELGQWDWYITITPVSGGGWIESSENTQLFTMSGTSNSIANERYEQSMSLDEFRKFLYTTPMYPGTYELDFYYIIHDGSEFNQFSSMAFDDEDFKDFVQKSGYMSGYKETRTLELKAEDFTSQFAQASRNFDISYPAACPR